VPWRALLICSGAPDALPDWFSTVTARSVATAVDDGVLLRTWTSGVASERPPVVLLHGGPGLWDYLEPLARLLDDSTVVHRYDQRGCGGSGDGGPITMARWVADLDSLRADWGHERWVVVGHSFGATVALAYAGAHPGRTAGVGYLSGVGIGDWRTPLRAELIRRRSPAHAARLADLHRLAQRTPDEERELRVLSWSTDYADPEVGAKHAADMAASPHTIRWDINAALNHGDDEIADEEVVRIARSLRVHVSFVHGRVDPRPWQASAALADASGHGSIDVVDGAGHLPWVERPGQVRRLLTVLLDRATTSG